MDKQIKKRKRETRPRKGKYAGYLTVTFCAAMLDLPRYKVRDHFQSMRGGRRPEDVPPVEVYSWMKELERNEKGKSRFADYGFGSSGLFRM